ncbi:hypothetical protein R1sor_012181 [Riccia sorocarpa]|uniref:RING-type domain-containing protein n=1 Tax=Riccia sorocarpa TaxID=122646 RepID=A0ABD3I6V9_9MARC
MLPSAQINDNAAQCPILRRYYYRAGELDFGASPATSYAPIVPHGEGPSSAPSTSSHTGWLPGTDREAVWNWIERAPFVLVDRRQHEAALRRLAESDDVEARLERQIESRFQTRLAEAQEGTKQAEEALRLAYLAVADLTSSAATLDGPLREELDGERVDWEALIAELDLTRGVAAGMDDEHVVDNGMHFNPPQPHPEGPVQPEVNPEVQHEVQAEAEVDATGGPTLTPAEELEAAKKKITELEAEVAWLNDLLKITADALEVERRRNFADGSIRAAWDLERAEFERRIALLTRERDHAVRAYEERHRALEADIAERMRSVIPEELTPERLRSTWELLQRYDASVHSLSGIATGTHELVTKKYRNRRYDSVQLEGADLKMVVMRGNKAMWPPGRREAWNRVNDANDLSAIRHFFPGWAPLTEADGGTIGLSPIWHRVQCPVCLNYFGPEGVYLPGSCSHPIHLHCMLKLMEHKTQCGTCRAPYHSRMWFQFLVEKLIDGAAARNNTAFYAASREPFWVGGETKSVSTNSHCAIPEESYSRVPAGYMNSSQALAQKTRAGLETYLQKAHRDFADRRLLPQDRSPEYHLRLRVVELLHFYLCPSLASPGTYAEYGAELYSLVQRNWPPECFNWSEKFVPGLQHLEGGTATPGQAHGRTPSPPVVLSDDDEE